MSNAVRGLLTLTLGFALIVVTQAQADPMRPDSMRPVFPADATTRAPEPEPALTLTSIYRLDQRVYAVINGRWLTVNDRFSTYQIIDIGSNTVTLRRGNGTRTLTLQQAGSLAITPTEEE